MHAGKKCAVADYDAEMLFVESFVDPALVHQVPDIGELQLGGFVGRAKLVDCVTKHASPWFTGCDAESPGGPAYGFVLAEAMPLPFAPWKGRLGFFNVPVYVKCGHGFTGEMRVDA